MVPSADAASWEKWAQLWGPAVPMFAVLVFYLHRQVYVTIPHGFRTLRKVIHNDMHRNTTELEKHYRILRRLERRLDDVQMCRKHPPRARPRRRDPK